MEYYPKFEGVDHFPPSPGRIPFGEELNDLFFNPRQDNRDFPVHGPNVVRLVRGLLADTRNTPGLLRGESDEREHTAVFYDIWRQCIKDNLGIAPGDVASEAKAREFLTIAALYHDIGKTIRRARHPQIGANLLRNFDERKRNELIDALAARSDTDEEQKRNRFFRLCSVVEHHDKFGVVSTGEGGLPILSDILYFASDKDDLEGIRKNVTSVMLVNLADVAAVSTIPNDGQSFEIVGQVHELRCPRPHSRSCERSKPASALCGRGKGAKRRPQVAGGAEQDLLETLEAICKGDRACLGLSREKAEWILGDWGQLIGAIEAPEVQGDRKSLNQRLLEIECNPKRAIERIRRLLVETVSNSGCGALLEYMTAPSVEAHLVGRFGPFQFERFCEHLALVAKLDYGLKFFKAIVCGCVRNTFAGGVGPSDDAAPFDHLSEEEQRALGELDEHQDQAVTRQITSVFASVLRSLVSRYAGELGAPPESQRRFGFQLHGLTADPNIRSKIIDLLCLQRDMDYIALNWIADEITVWSMD